MELRDRIAEVLAEHLYYSEMYECSCQRGQEYPDTMDWREHAAHQAAALLPLIREAVIRESAAIGWDAAVKAMKYTDGTPVELAVNVNPYRAEQEANNG